MSLEQTLREELAMNPHGDDDGNLRCVCVECAADLGETLTRDLAAAFKEHSEALYQTLILDGHGRAAVSATLHALHVRIHALRTP